MPISCYVCNDTGEVGNCACARCRPRERRDQIAARKDIEAKRIAAIDPRRWLAQVEERSQSKSRTYLLAVIMATRADSKGFVRLTNDRLMELCRCKRAKFFEMIAELIALNELRLHKKGRGKGNHSVYQLLSTQDL